jgi:SAM-dependent methyltransferase
MRDRPTNVHSLTVEDFGREWTTFDQAKLPAGELHDAFERYFAIFPWEALPTDAEGFDFGCGSGRWARMVAPRVGRLHCVDASPAALTVAHRNLSAFDNCEFHHSVAETLPFEHESMDFGYSLGVLHHVPDPAGALRACVQTLKPGAPFLLYLYYRFDNRPIWFRILWRGTDLFRRGISRLPHKAKVAITSALAVTVYWPLARASRALERMGRDISSFPLSYYRQHSLYVMRTDALDRFGTRLEHRFTADEIRRLMQDAGLADIVVSESEPFWCALGRRALEPS